MIETVLNVAQPVSLLRIETTMDQTQLHVPPSLKVQKDVTHEPAYSSRSLALEI